MVSENLLALSSVVLGSTPFRILVTGGTGFVGSEVATTLAAAGHNVTVTGRNRYAAPRGKRITFRRADIRNKKEIVAICGGQDFVIHAAADTSPSATASKLHQVNVVGTENVIAGCVEHQVKRMVHVSSTAIHFAFQDAFDIRDDSPLPVKFACGYAESKAIAEQKVMEASKNGLNAFTVRARAVFGSRDACLLPRIFRAYDEGRLRRIGDGQNVTELTYIDNLVYGVIRALRRGDSGGVCTISGGEPVKLWELLQRVLKSTGRDKPLRPVSFPVAMMLGRFLQTKHRLLNKPGEPALTPYSVGLLGKSQTFSQAAAIEQLDYSPIVKLSEGIETTIQSLQVRDNGNASVSVDLKLRSTGYTTARANLVEPDGDRTKIKLHATIAIIEHPKFGVTLFDTGYSPRFYDATEKWPYWLLSKATPVETNDSISALSVVEQLGIDRNSVQRIIVSHFHSDHICGLSDFPNAEIVATRSACDSARGVRGFDAVRKAIAPDLVPTDLESRLCLFSHFLDPGIGPFDRSQDLFGDGSVRLIAIPGHAIGQIGAIVQTGPTERKFLVADAVWTRRTVTEDLALTAAFRMVAADWSETRQTKERLVRFAKEFPDIEILPTHCPEVVQQYQLDPAPIEKAE